MEILPHFWIGYYENDEFSFIQKKGIRCILHISKHIRFFKNSDIEELHAPIDYDDNQDSFEIQNTAMYQQLADITNYIHERIMDNETVLLMCSIGKQDLETILVAYYIRYAKLSIEHAIEFLKTKMENIFYPKCIFYLALKRFKRDCG